MEKSLVRQFASLGNARSSAFGNIPRNGFIRTIHDGNDIGKSRIQNLPSYKKDDLSKRLDMVVVFQSIQIERLSLQIESLRVQLKDSERQQKIYHSYQIQIKELTQQYQHLQQQHMHQKQQNQKMNIICQKMYSQLQGMHQKYNDLDPKIGEKYRNAIKQNKELQKQIKNMQRVGRDMQEGIRQLKTSCNQKTQQLTNQNNNLANKVSSQQNQIIRIQKQIKQQKISQIVIDQLNRLKQVEKDYQNKHRKIVRELEEKSIMLHNLKAIVRNKMNQTQQQKQKLNNMDLEIGQKLNSLQDGLKNCNIKLQKQLQAMARQNQKLMKSVDSKQEQVNELSKVYQQKLYSQQQANKQYESKNLQYEHQNKQLQTELNMLKNQSDCLNKQLNDKNEQNGRFLRRLNQLQNEVKSEVKNLHTTRQIIEDKIMKLLEQIQAKNDKLKQIEGSMLAMKNQDEMNMKQKQNLILNFHSIIQQMQKNYQGFSREKQKSYELQCKVQDLSSKINNNESDRIIRQKRLTCLQQQLGRTLQAKSQTEKQLSNLTNRLEDSNKKFSQIQKNHSIDTRKLKSQHQKQMSLQQQKFKLLLLQLQSIKKSYDQQLKQRSAQRQRILQMRNDSQNQSTLLSQIVRRLEVCEKLFVEVRQKNSKFSQQKKDKLKQTMNKTSQVFRTNEDFAQKIIHLQDLVYKLEDQNSQLQSDIKLLNFQIVQTHKINSMKKRRDSRTSIQSTSLKSFANTNPLLRNKQKKVGSLTGTSPQRSQTPQIPESQSSRRLIFQPIINKV